MEINVIAPAMAVRNQKICVTAYHELGDFAFYDIIQNPVSPDIDGRMGFVVRIDGYQYFYNSEDNFAYVMLVSAYLSGRRMYVDAKEMQLKIADWIATQCK